MNEWIAQYIRKIKTKSNPTVSMPIFEQVAILGPGLLGASLATAVRERKICERIVVWGRKEERLESCRAKPWCDFADRDLQKILFGSDLIVCCTPVDSIREMVGEIMPRTVKDVLVTDVGSVKESICREAREASTEESGTFVGSHPMAGSEKSGMEFASADLFLGRTCILTPDEDCPDEEVKRLTEFWGLLGMKIQVESPCRHDEIVANVSHLPHFLASSLGQYLSKRPKEWMEASGQGLRDTTRIAQGDAGLWLEIMKANQSKLSDSLDHWTKSLEEAKEFLRKGEWENLEKFLADGAHLRKSLGSGK